jgi:hypothetical protein
MFDAFLDDADVSSTAWRRRRRRRHAQARGIHRARATGVLHGAKTFVLQDEDGQTVESHSISAGLDYPGVGPEHAWLADIGRAEYIPATDTEAMEALRLLSQTEGIIPAIESAHALAGRCGSGRELGPDAIIAVSLSGRGDKDMDTAARWFGLYDEGQRHDLARGGRDRRGEGGRSRRLRRLPAARLPDLQTSIDAAVASGGERRRRPRARPALLGPGHGRSRHPGGDQAALAAGFRLRDTFTAVRAIADRVDVPILVMTYWNPVLHGVDRFADDLVAAGGAGLITPISPRPAPDWIAASERTGLDRVFLAARPRPTSDCA